jgi:hypothetical protein
MIINFPGFGRIDVNLENEGSPKRMDGVFYRRGREGCKKGRKEKLSLK